MEGIDFIIRSVSVVWSERASERADAAAQEQRAEGSGRACGPSTGLGVQILSVGRRGVLRQKRLAGACLWEEEQEEEADKQEQECTRRLFPRFFVLWLACLLLFGDPWKTHLHPPSTLHIWRAL